jgi:hypothetical protein
MDAFTAFVGAIVFCIAMLIGGFYVADKIGGTFPPSASLVQELQGQIIAQDTNYNGRTARCYTVMDKWDQTSTTFVVQDDLVVVVEITAKTGEKKMLFRKDDSFITRPFNDEWIDWEKRGKAVWRAGELATPVCKNFFWRIQQNVHEICGS